VLAHAEDLGFSTFSATMRLSEICSARNTVPMPPAPSFAMTR